MRNLKPLVVLLALFAFIPQAALAALTLAQTPATNTGTGTTPTVTFASAPPSTHLLVGILSTALPALTALTALPALPALPAIPAIPAFPLKDSVCQKICCSVWVRVQVKDKELVTNKII